MLKMPIVTPIAAPTKISVGKCTPNATREKPTKPAQQYSGINSEGEKWLRIVAITKAAEVCPEGKLNLSDGLIKL